MTRRRARGLTWLAYAVTSASLFQFAFTAQNGGVGGCERFTTNGLATSVDFCYLLDCQNGFLGGAVQVCGDNNIFVDCPGIDTEEE